MAEQDNTLQPNWPQYQKTGDATSKQTMQNATAAHAAEASICNALGAGWGKVGGTPQANPKGAGSIPSGVTGLKVKAPGKTIK